MSETAKSASSPLPRLPTPTASDSGARSLPPHPQKKDADKKKKATRATPNSKGNESMLARRKMHLGNSPNPSVSNSELPSLSGRGDPFASSSSVNLDTELGLRERPLVGDVPREKKNLDPTVGRRQTASPSALGKEKKKQVKKMMRPSVSCLTRKKVTTKKKMLPQWMNLA